MHVDGEFERVLISALILGGGFLSLELGISVAIFEVLAGVVAVNVFGIESPQWIDFPANFGLLGVMFFAGFETDFPLLTQTWRESTKIAIGSFFLPLAVIIFLAKFVLHLGNEQSLLIAIGLSTTSLALVYSVFNERGLIANRSAQLMLSAAMIVDMLSMLALTILFEGVSWSTLIVLSMLPVGRYLMPHIGHWIFHRYRGNQVEFRIKFILLVLLSLSLLSHKSRIHVSVLAFIAGFFFSEIIEEHRELEDKLKSIVFGLMAPIFFFKAGLAVHLSLVTGETVYYGLLLGSVAYVTKYLGTYFAMRQVFRSTVARFAGLIFNFRLSFGIVVATFGAEMGLLSQEMFLALIGVVIVSSILSSILVRTIPHEI